jgi:hypothetical protein
LQKACALALKGLRERLNDNTGKFPEVWRRSNEVPDEKDVVGSQNWIVHKTLVRLAPFQIGLLTAITPVCRLTLETDFYHLLQLFSHLYFIAENGEGERDSRAYSVV